jgi:hypothetical protein
LNGPLYKNPVMTISIMADKSLLLFISTLGITPALTLSVSNIHAATVNNTDFSIEVPNGWVYREDFFFDNGTLLTPNEFAEFLITPNMSAFTGVGKNAPLAEIAPDPRFPIKNAPVEIYAKYASKFANNFFPTYENATIGGERAIKLFLNSTDITSKLAKTNVTANLVTTSYFVIHDDQPYFLSYMANAKDYQKYQPQFEQMVKTFKFVK